jgi:2-C-methyl-D-erythritol 2,4-cyclodiphosphate synthase
VNAVADARSAGFRIGHGYDIHRIQPGGRLVLGGVTVSTTHSAVAHSDGDVVLHAIVDAILGALGLEDIGELFPNEPKWKNAESRVFIEQVMLRVRSSHMRIANVDVTIMAERPNLKPYKAKMRETITKLVEAPVNIKAGTNEGCDAVGRGEAIAAHAVILLTPAE